MSFQTSGRRNPIFNILYSCVFTSWVKKWRGTSRPSPCYRPAFIPSARSLWKIQTTDLHICVDRLLKDGCEGDYHSRGQSQSAEMRVSRGFLGILFLGVVSQGVNSLTIPVNSSGGKAVVFQCNTNALEKKVDYLISKINETLPSPKTPPPQQTPGTCSNHSW